MDLNQLATVEKHEAGAECRLHDPQTGKPDDGVVIIQGVDSKAWRDAQKKQRRKYKDVDDIDMFDHEYLAPIIAACITGWQNLKKGTEKFEYSEENALWLCENSPTLVTQLFSFVIDRENFTGG
tara:strand:+ start:381 stop:752 length:372 start_codon:yes stop_codon:yes gene_type:complete